MYVDHVRDTDIFIFLSSRLQGNTSDDYRKAKHVLDVYIAPIVLILGLTGNMLSLIVLLNKSLRNSSHTLLLCSLAVSDTILLITFLMRSWLLAAFDIDIRTGSSVICKTLLFMMYFGSHLSSWTLGLVALERLVSVAWPLQAFHYCSRRRIVIAWVVMSGLLLLVNGHIFWTADVISESPKHPVCAFNTRYYQFAYEIYPWIDMSVMTLTFVVLLICNSVIIIILNKARRKRNNNMTSNGNHHHSDHVTDVTMMLTTVSLFYLLTTTPFMIHLLGLGVDMSPKLDALVSTTLQILFCTNYSVNFFLYVLSGSRFRQTLFKMCVKQKSEITTVKV